MPRLSAGSARNALLLCLLTTTACEVPIPIPDSEPERLGEVRQGLEAVVTPLASKPSGSDPTMPAPLPALTTTPVGKIPAAFSVTPSGSATYSIPIEVPPGRNGMQPALSVDYSSRRKDGVLGTGWVLNGVSSAITPCGRDMTQPEGYVAGVRWSQSNDLLCLDGEPLVLVNGGIPAPLYGDNLAEYKTDRDGFKKIVQNGRPATSFTVFTKDGRVLTYGDSAACSTCNGRARARTGATRAWGLSTVADRFGNQMTITWTHQYSTALEDYNQDTFPDYTGAPEVTESYPTFIKYADSRAIYLDHSLRTDRSRGWTAGIRSERSRRLTSIRSYLGTQRVRTYNFGYMYSASTRKSLLTSVEECAGAGDGVCKPKTFLEYSAGSNTYGAPQQTQIISPPMGLAAAGAFPSTPVPIIAMDVNDDGKTDLVYPKAPFNQTASFTNLTWRILKMGTSGMANATEINTNIPAAWPFAALPADLNQDGKTDLLLLDNATFWRALITNATGTGFTYTTLNTGKSQSFIGTGSTAIENFARFTRIADLNGDSAPDLLSCESTGGGFRWSYRFNTGAGFGSQNLIPLGTANTADCRDDAVNALMIDTDGDRATELVFAVSGQPFYQAVFFNKPSLSVRNTQLPSSVPGTFSANKLRLADINHDGLTDVLTGMSVPGPTFGTTMRYWLNLGDRFSGGLHGYRAYEDDFGQYSASLVSSVLLDHDGDASQDLLVDGERTSTSGCGGSGQETCPPVRSGNLEILRNDLVDAWPPAPKLSVFDTGVGPLCKSYPRGHMRARAIDENGDLLPDLVFIDTTSGGDSQTNPCWSHPGQFVFARHAGAHPDLLVKVRDGMIGMDSTSSLWPTTATVQIAYQPSSSASVYAETYRHEAEKQIQQVNAQIAAQAAEYDQSLEAAREQARAGTLGEFETAKAAVEELTAQRDQLQETLDGLADRIRESQAAARAQLEQEQSRVVELEAQLAEASKPSEYEGTFHPAQAEAITEAITDAMNAYRVRTDAIASENEAVARNEDAKLTAALRKAFHAISHQK